VLSSFMIVLLFFVLGVVAILLEIVTPGGVLAILGGAFMLVAVAVAFLRLDFTAGLGTLALALVVGPLTFMIGMRVVRTTAVGSVLGLNTELGKEDGYVASDVSLEELVGATGQALTSLRPAGMAMFEGRRVDVVTRGFMIAKGTPVKVVEVEGNRVVVVEDKGAPT